jgi:trigger factor
MTWRFESSHPHEPLAAIVAKEQSDAYHPGPRQQERTDVKTTLTEQEGNAVRLDIEVSDDEIRQGVDETVANLAKELKLPGFRKGKVPQRLVVQRFGMEAVIHQMLEDRLPVWYGEALKETGIEPVDSPQVDFDAEPEVGKAFSFHAVVQVMPKPVLGQYKGLEVPKAEAEVKDADVDAQVERLRQDVAQLRVVDLRAAQEGDVVTADFAGSLEGEGIEKATLTDFTLELGSGQFLPDLENGLPGMHVGEEKDLAVSFPEDYPDEDVAGKTLDFHVTLKEIKEKVLPPLNDELAKDVSEFATLLELRLDIRRKLQSMRDNMVTRQFRALAIKQAVDLATVDIPAPVVDRQAESLVDDFGRSLELRGGKFEDYLEATGATVEQMLVDVRPDAVTTVKTGLVLDAIAAKEGLEVSDDDLEATVAALAKAGGQDPAVLRSRLEESGRIGSIRQNLLREKAGDLIVESAVAVAAPSPSEPATEVDEAAEPGGESDEGIE